jgi:hypothetical protein
MIVSEEKHPTWQALINNSYDKWANNKKMSYVEFLDSLEDVARKAIELKNLNYQVENGGFEQWFGNGYVESDMDGVIETLKNSIITEAGKKALEILNEASNSIEFYEGVKEQYHRVSRYAENNLLDEFQSEFSDLCDERLAKELRALDNDYYNINKALMDDIENWLLSASKA